MTALCVRGRMAHGALHWLVCWLLAGLFLAAVASRSFADEPITVSIDQATILKLPERAATVVIGDPLIADMTLQPGGIAIVTGKGYGATNVVVMDRSGAVLMEKMVEVKGPNDKVVMVYRGVSRQTYSCTPECSPRITLGDTSKDDFDKDSGLPSAYFSNTLNQAITRNSQAMAAGAGGSGK
jgi:hypothetical protein